MKQFFLTSLMVFLGLKVYAIDAVDSKHQDFNTQAFELLVKNADAMKLEGDMHPGEKLKPILDDLGDFLASHLFAIMGDDPDDYTGSIKSFTADCTPTTQSSLSSKCVLIIQYKPLGETGLTFFVSLDKDKKPERIIENRVQISRGD